MQKRKICLFSYTLSIGGAERYIADLANYLASVNYEVTVVLLRKQSVDYILNDDIQLVQPYDGFPAKKWMKLLYVIKTLIFIRKIVTSIKPDIVLNVAFPAFFLLSLTGIDVPVCTSIRCDPSKTRLIEGLYIPTLIRKIIYRRSNILIAQTCYAHDYLKQQFQSNEIKLIPNFIRAMQSYDVEKENYIIYVSRIIPLKNHIFLLKAFSEIAHSGWKLLVVGDGPLLDDLKLYADALNIANDVIFTGKSKDVDILLQRSAIFAFTSTSEGFPNALLEAMFIGLPCLCLDCVSGPSDLITHGENGFLVKMGDAGLFKQYLENLMLDSDLRVSLGTNASESVKKHSIENIGADYVEMFDRLMSKSVSC